MNLATYLSQHQSIMEASKGLSQLMKDNNIEEHAADIAKQINVLAGKINMHLAMEDRYLYPNLLSKEQVQLTRVVEEYISEMGHLSQTFNTYKEKYHTRHGILANISSIKMDTQVILSQITERIQKEETGLYKRI